MHKFWFRFINKYQNFIQTDLYEQLRDIVRRDYPVYSGFLLEKYFREKLKEQKAYYMIGAWWCSTSKSQDNPCEIDIVAIKPYDKDVFVAEVKRNPKKFSEATFLPKVEIFASNVMPKAHITTAFLSLDDM